MTDRERATSLMVQATFLLYPERGQAQVTPGEWLTLCDDLLERKESLGQLGNDLARRRAVIEEKAA